MTAREEGFRAVANSGWEKPIGRLFRDPSGQDELFEQSLEEALEARRGTPVECLGLTFENDQGRRIYFLERLRDGLDELHTKLGSVPWTGVDDTVARMAAVEQWPMGDEPRLRNLADRMSHADSSKDLLQRWKDEVGFPHGEIDDILKLSDPPWHTACPNPFLGAFVKTYGKPYDPDEPYRRTPFAIDIREGKTHAVYRAHSYHTKVPHLAIIPSILHYTEPGDLVLDGFAGTGMTGVAAQWCGTAAESYRKSLEAKWAKEGLIAPNWGVRHTIQNDLSPLAGFIAANYSLPFDVEIFAEAGRMLLDEVEAEIGWMYETLHTDGETKGRIDYTVWSEVFGCPDCNEEIVFVNEALDKETKRIHSQIECPHCGSIQRKESMDLRFERFHDPGDDQICRRPRREPVLIFYRVDGKKFEKTPDSDDAALLGRISSLPFPSDFPTLRLPKCQMTRVGRVATTETNAVHHMFLARAAHALAAMWRRASTHPDTRIRHMLLYLVEQAVWTMATLNRYRPTGYSQVNQFLSGVFYVPSQHSECSPSYVLGGKLKRLIKAFRVHLEAGNNACAVTASTAASLGIPDDSIDYIFTDPPFGENLYYADLNFLIESWHGVLTNAVPEAIVDRFKKKGLPEYQQLMQRCFEEYQRVLKPGRWITVVFHNSKNAVWTAIQEAMLASGFVVADVRTLDKQQGSFKQVTSTAVKQDLVISAYKPNDGLEERFVLTKGTEEGVWDFLRTHLAQLPVFVLKDGCVEVVNERQPHILFDRMVAFHVLRNVTVPLSIGDFLVGVAQRFPERDGMAFLSDQVVEYDRRRMAAREVAQLEIFVIDESSAIQWIRRLLARKPQRFQDIHPQFLQEIAGWRKHEKLPELSEMLDQNFLRYDGIGVVPSQIHAYLSTNYKELRKLPKDHPALRSKAAQRWYVPDPKKAIDVEMRRTHVLLREFDEYRRSSQKRLRLFRLEAVRAGFFRAYQEQDYATIIKVAEKIPDAILREDQKLMLWYDQAVTRLGVA